MVTALGRAWHPEHFLCSGCSTTLGGSSFFEKDGAPFCPECYFERFSPRCGFCNQPIRHVSSAEPRPVACFTQREDRPNADLSPSYPTPSCLSCFPSLTPNSLLVLPPTEIYFLLSSLPSPPGLPRPPFPEGGGGKRGRKDSSVLFHFLQKMVTALGTHWHPEHFCCVSCGEPFGEEGESSLLKAVPPV